MFTADPPLPPPTKIALSVIGFQGPAFPFLQYSPYCVVSHVRLLRQVTSSLKAGLEAGLFPAGTSWAQKKLLLSYIIYGTGKIG